MEDGLEAIDRSARLQLQLINDLLDVSRITTGKIQLEMEYAELFDLAEGVVEMVRPMAEMIGQMIIQATSRTGAATSRRPIGLPLFLVPTMSVAGVRLTQRGPRSARLRGTSRR